MRRLVPKLFVFLIALGIPLSVGSAPVERAGDHFLTGRLLVSAKGMQDPRFAESLVYMIDHNDRGATGLIINKPALKGPLSDLLGSFGVDKLTDKMKTRDVVIFYGGPVDAQALFILHTNDYSSAGTERISSKYSVTTSLDILEAIARGEGPKRWLFVGGYSGWGPGQLEMEFERQDWLIAPASEALLFGSDNDSKWQRAHAGAGLDL